MVPWFSKTCIEPLVAVIIYEWWMNWYVFGFIMLYITLVIGVIIPFIPLKGQNWLYRGFQTWGIPSRHDMVVAILEVLPGFEEPHIYGESEVIHDGWWMITRGTMLYYSLSIVDCDNLGTGNPNENQTCFSWFSRIFQGQSTNGPSQISGDGPSDAYFPGRQSHEAQAAEDEKVGTGKGEKAQATLW